MGENPKAKSIDSTEFVRLVVAHESRVRAFISTILIFHSEADDVMQNVSIVAWEKYSSFTYLDERPDEEFVHWLCAIAKYSVLQLCERKKRRGQVAFSANMVEQLAELHITHESRTDMRHHALDKCLEKLPARDQVILRKYYRREEPVERIAEWAGQSKSAVYKSLQRIRSVLGQCIEVSVLKWERE